jgi:diguanylate cyclase (GGDEF)-like protein
VRASDTPARYGGEEFAVVLPRASVEQAVDVGERIRRSIAAIDPAGLGLHDPVTASVGVAVARGRDIDIAELLESADRALYDAKRQGRNRVAVA